MPKSKACPVTLARGKGERERRKQVLYWEPSHDSSDVRRDPTVEHAEDANTQFPPKTFSKVIVSSMKEFLTVTILVTKLLL